METTATDNWLTAEAAAQLIGCHRSTFDRVHDEYGVERCKASSGYRYNPAHVRLMAETYTPERVGVQLSARKTTVRITPETLAAAEQAMMRRRALVLATCKRQPERRPFDVATELMRFGHV